TSFSVTYTDSDPLKNGSNSGVADVELWAKAPGAGSYSKVATDSGVAIDGSFSFTGTVDGSYDFYTRAHDKAGNYEAAPATGDTSTLVDTQQPSSQDNADTNWHKADVTVHLSASDQPGLSGVADIKYIVNGGSIQTAS